jgi:hypothetical protein
MSQFVLTTTTDTGHYPPGQTVAIDLTLRDTSPVACQDTTVLMWGCYGATATDGAGAPVWASWAGPDSTPVNCPAEIVPATIPADFSTSATLSWAQDRCTQPVTDDQPNPDCPQTQVPSGAYQMTSEWAGFSSQAPVTIDISPS